MIMAFARLSPARRRLAWFSALVGLATGVIVARSARAQQAPVTFVYLRGTDTLGTETVAPGNGVVRGVLQYRGQPRLEWEQVRTPLRLTLTVFAPGGAPDAAPVQVASFAPQGDSLSVEVGTRGAMRPQMMPIRPGAVPFINNSLLHSALLTQLARELGVSTLPLFLTQGAQTIDATIERRGDTTTMTVAGMAMRIVWADGAPVSVDVPAQNLRAIRAGATAPRPPAAPTNTKPATNSYDAPANASYTSQALTIPTTRGYTLAGTLTMPKSARGKVPVVVTISGSGPQERDSRIAIVPGYALFREIADTLSRRGIAVLRYDDRGVGESGGRSSAIKGTSADWADDARSVIAMLRARADIDGQRIALIGHSEGGIIAPMIAATDAQLRAVALLAGPAYAGRRVSLFQNRQVLDATPSLTPAQRDSIMASVPAMLDTVSQPWTKFWLAYDPLPTAQRVKQPVLILQGDTDMQVTPEQADTLATALRRAGNRAVTLKRFPATNHLFLADASGAPQGYSALKDVHVRRDVLGTLANWLVTTLK
ncbi:alpha/beta hydrolase family protein [Gemmatimonas sp.]|uniref:alpha/beta hydrolase family protein n=1 Tax=Gemmatimonas sp. TaxID=1962908 RepID=UPI003DA66EEC